MCLFQYECSVFINKTGQYTKICLYAWVSFGLHPLLFHVESLMGLVVTVHIILGTSEIFWKLENHAPLQWRPGLVEVYLHQQATRPMGEAASRSRRATP